MIRLAHADAVALIDPAVGNIPSWQVAGRKPLHAAAWRDDPQVQADAELPLVERRLAGDFLCLPFGAAASGDDPLHGWTANSAWTILEHDVAHATLRLGARPYGAEITKRVQLVESGLLQTHVIEGGLGEVTLAHHPMSHMAEGGRLSFSPKRAALTDPLALCPGRNLWSVNQLRGDLHLDCEDGRQWDLRQYPARHRVEDFAILVEARGARLGWTVVIRQAEDDMLVIVKEARVLPITMLWISNGGREFPPWNGRHTGVIGIEDGVANGPSGLGAATGENRLTALGVPTTLSLGPRHVIRHAMISLPRPPGWVEVVALSITRGTLSLTEASGAQIAVPFMEGFFPQ
ncbi:hypothetical protein roselon_02979 [Roseibacterium elongatum DSM 19469]|uniref:Uncharacterized protein n=1 Tax=Roseicyclus elongatus DSM 19469 TaxID=1294273 RepID=W8SRU6_9RHOB|nr:hypothetical protein [Roseibacterium elongatum]AHM05260.1 hypothetical protein roselon_02979 [Roseibacterium elongatum DSM 19469]